MQKELFEDCLQWWCVRKPAKKNIAKTIEIIFCKTYAPYDAGSIHEMIKMKALQVKIYPKSRSIKEIWPYASNILNFMGDFKIFCLYESCSSQLLRQKDRSEHVRFLKHGKWMRESSNTMQILKCTIHTLRHPDYDLWYHLKTFIKEELFFELWNCAWDYKERNFLLFDRFTRHLLAK